MKEKIFKKGIARRLFSAVLALVMIVTLLPMENVTVYAAESYSSKCFGRVYDIGAGGAILWVIGSEGQYGISKEANLAVGDTLTNCKFRGGYSGVVYLDGRKQQNDTINITGEIVKIDGGTLYLCTNSSHDSQKNSETDLCDTCARKTCEHNWVYSLDGTNKIVAECNPENGSPCPDLKSASLILVERSVNYTGSSISKDRIFCFVDFTTFNDATNLGLSLNDIKIYAADDTSKATPLDSINAAGSYIAELTVDTNKTATIEFTVKELIDYALYLKADGTATKNTEDGETIASLPTGLSYDSENDEWTMNNFVIDINQNEGKGIIFGAENVKLNIVGNNEIKVFQSEYGWRSRAIKSENLTIAGDGTLTAISGESGARQNSYAIEATNLTINGGNVIATGGESDGCVGIYADNLTINAGNVTASGIEYSYGNGIEAKTVIINGGCVETIGSASGFYCNWPVESISINSALAVVAGNDAASATKPTFDTDWKTTLNGKKYVKIEAPSHNHNFDYSASGAVLTATCDVDDCDLEQNKVTLTLSASDANYSGSAATITLEGKVAWENAEIAVPEIKYFKGSEALSEAPTTPGDYTAKISAGDPAVIASVDYTILVEKSAEEVEAVKNAIDKITAIGTVEYTDACKAKIDAARTAYNALAEHLRSLVTNYNVLTTAEAKYVELKAAAEKLEADTLAANAVDTLIKAIGTVDATDACKAKIDAARKAYDALTADQKKLVKELKTLEDAEKAYEALKPAPTPSPDPTPAPTPIPVPAPEAIELGTSYDTIQTTETVTSKGKVTGITISANSISMNGILTVNANLKVTILDGKWSVAGYSEDRVTPATLNAVKWLAADGTKQDAKLLKKYAKAKYYKATKKSNPKTLITAVLNKKDIDGVYAVKLVDDQGHSIVLNIECTKLAKISKKDALKITEAGKSVSANDILAMADGESVKTISLSFVGKDKNVSKSSFNNNAITWKVGTGKKAQTIKCGEVTEYTNKKGEVIGYLTLTKDGSLKVLAGSVKGKLSLSATLYGKVYKTSVSIKK